MFQWMAQSEEVRPLRMRSQPGFVRKARFVVILLTQTRFDKRAFIAATKSGRTRIAPEPLLLGPLLEGRVPRVRHRLGVPPESSCALAMCGQPSLAAHGIGGLGVAIGVVAERAKAAADAARTPGRCRANGVRSVWGSVEPWVELRFSAPSRLSSGRRNQRSGRGRPRSRACTSRMRPAESLAPRFTNGAERPGVRAASAAALVAGHTHTMDVPVP